MLRVFVAAAAAAACAGAVLLRKRDRTAEKDIARLQSARLREEWRTDDKLAELEQDLEEQRERATVLGRKLNAKRVELARLRGEHAGLLRRYAKAETERASALESARLALGAAPAPAAETALGPSAFLKANAALDALVRNAARQAEQAAEEAEDLAAARAADEAAAADAAAKAAGRKAAGKDGDGAAGDGEAVPEESGATPAEDGEDGAGSGNAAEAGADAEEPAAGSADEDSADAGSADEDGADENGAPAAARNEADRDAVAAEDTHAASPTRRALPEVRTAHEHAPANPGAAVAVVPASALRRTESPGPGFDFFGTKGAAAEVSPDEDLADVLGDELTRDGDEDVIDLTAHDETETIDVRELRALS